MASGSMRIKSPLLAGLAYMFVIVLIGTVLISLLLSMTGIMESSLLYFAYPLHIGALFIGGWVSGKRAGEKGWYHGGMSGLVYAVTLTLIGFLGFDLSIGLDGLVIIAVSFASSAVGGMIGVNTAK